MRCHFLSVWPAEAALATAFLGVWAITDGPGRSFGVWQNNLPEFTREAGTEAMTEISQALDRFCHAWQDFNSQVTSKWSDLGLECQAFVQKATEVVTDCIPSILESMKQRLEGQLLCKQAFFQERAQHTDFLPAIADVKPEWWTRCCSFWNECQASWTP